MKPYFLLTICHLPLVIFCQEPAKDPWTFECGITSNIFFSVTPSIDLRYISPSFKFSNDNLTEEEEEKKTKDFRLMLELLYGPPLRTLGAGIKIQYCLVNKKKISLEPYIGLKLFIVPGPDYIKMPRLKEGKNMWYYNLGIILHAHLGVISPFLDIGTDGIATIGTELDFHAIYKNPKRRYKLRRHELQPSD